MAKLALVSSSPSVDGSGAAAGAATAALRRSAVLASGDTEDILGSEDEDYDARGEEPEDAAAGVDVNAAAAAAAVAGEQPSTATDADTRSCDATGTAGTLDGIEYVWQAPPPGVALRAVLFVAHGCSHSSPDWWPHHAVCCPSCIGLPEERRIVRAALARGMLVIAVSSANADGSKCWHMSDLPRVGKVLRHVRAAHQALTLPLFAFGASSGGSFVGLMGFKRDGGRKNGTADTNTAAATSSSSFPTPCGIEVQISHINPSVLHLDFPALVFTHMPRDRMTAGAVERAVRMLAPTKVAIKVLEMHPRAVTAEDLTFAWGPRMGGEDKARAAAEAVVDVLRQQPGDGALRLSQPDTFLLRQDPRRSSWRHVLRDAVHRGGAKGELIERALDLDTLVNDASPLSEELNVAYAAHELSSEHIEDTLDFFLRQPCVAAAAPGMAEAAAAA